MKQRGIAALLALLLVFSLSACGKGSEAEVTGTPQTASEAPTGEPVQTAPAADNAETPEPETAQKEHGKILVVSFSATGNTKPLAEYAAEILGADLYEIVPEESYTAEDLNYNDSSTRATVEQNTPSARPAISGTVENMDQYDTVIIAHPIWWGKEPKIIDTFIESYDFTGKTMTTLCTSGSSGISTSAANLQAAVPGATWLESRKFAAGTDKTTVEQWLKEIGLAE